jgi:N6-L-threonylcarbamoyladenine synthase
MLDRDTYDFSFSGVKTAVRTHVLQMTNARGERLFHDDGFWPLPTSLEWESHRNNIMASFQQAVVDVLVAKTRRAVMQTGARAIVVVGGVACNSTLRRDMCRAGEECGVPVFFPSPILCTDNAAMIACAATHRYQMAPHYYYKQGFLDLDAQPALTLSNVLTEA